MCGVVRSAGAGECEQEISNKRPVAQKRASGLVAMYRVLPADPLSVRIVLEERPDLGQITQRLACMRMCERSADDVRGEIRAVKMADRHLPPQIVVNPLRIPSFQKFVPTLVASAVQPE